MRKYTDKDYDYIYNSLAGEGLTKEEMTFETDITFLTDFGFFSYRIDGRYPRLIHFYVDKDKRLFRNARKLFRLFWREVIKGDYPFYIMEVPKEKSYISRFALYLKGKEYLEQDGNRYFYIPISGRLK